jgi:hypothetical protein
MNSGFSFDPIKHTYELGGMRIPSCSAILDIIGEQYFSKNKTNMHRGNYIHECCALDLQNCLDLRAIDTDGEMGWINAFRVGMESLRLRSIPIIEQPIYSGKYKYGVTPDYIFLDDKTIIDLKTGVFNKKRDILQLHAQAQAAKEFYGIKIEWLINLYIKLNGSFLIKKYKFKPAIFNDFYCLLRTWYIKNFDLIY